MKIPGLIIACYVLLLVAMPCKDSRECESLAKSEQPNHNNHDDQEEGCTPFCICTCCPTSFYVPEPTIDNFAPAIFSELTCEITTEIHSFISHAIWQPPRTV